MYGLSGEALRIATEQPRFWQHKLFAQVVTDELDKCSTARQEHRAGTASGPREHVSEQDIPIWILARMNELCNRFDTYSRVMEFLATESFGASGSEQNIESMLAFARELGNVYCETIAWSQRFRKTDLPAMYQPFLNEAAEYTNNHIEAIESLAPSIMRQLEQHEESEVGGTFVMNLILDITPHNSEAFQRESEILVRKLRA
jgi:hypothetical protein